MKLDRSVVKITFKMILLQNFLDVGESKSARCDDLESLKKRNCPVASVENPRGSITINKDKPVTNRKKDVAEKLKPEQITQIQPQKLTLTLRSGKYPTRVVLKECILVVYQSMLRHWGQSVHQIERKNDEVLNFM